MDYMDSGLRYTPKSDKDWDTSVQFLPASDNKKLEKKKGPGKVGAVIGVVIFAAVVALMTGLLVWHFHFRKDVRVKKMYSGSMRITNQVFENAYENSNSTEFKALAKKVTSQLKAIYSKSPQLAKYYVGSTVQAFSEGSVIAYYLSEFRVPTGQEAAVDSAMTSMDKLVDKERRSSYKAGNDLVFEDVVSSALDARLFSTSFSRFLKFSEHAKPNNIGQIQSPGFPNSPYPPNTFMEWQLRADPNYVIKLAFDTMNLEGNCKNDFVKIYDSLVAIESRVMEEMCGYYSPSEPLTFLSSGNVMLVTMATNEKKNFPGFRAQVSQIQRGNKATTCGGQLRAEKGSFASPNFPNYYPPRTSCQWSIQVPDGKAVKLTFKKFLLSEPGEEKRKDCRKDYVEVNGKKLCGEKPDGTVTETSNTNTMSVLFFSDGSYVDRGFSAEFEAIDVTDPCPQQFQCRNQRCIKLDLKCDGWNDCGDMSDELNCKCNEKDITCKNGLCKPMFWKCDGVDDCGDRTDEMDCGGCSSGQITCKNNKCVSEKNRCDGSDDCGDGSDELDCGRTSGVSCTDLTYKCKNNKCINKVNPECDGTPDCEDGSDEESCDCGRNMFKTSRIVGGQDAEQGEFPWQVSLHVKTFGHVCGATIISPRWLVTAAHCVQDDGKIKFSQPGTWEAYLGLHTQGGIASVVAKRNLKQIIPHPNYNAYTFDNDIALMELDSPVTYSDYIRPICLPSPQHDFPTGSTVWITGWGATREGGSAAKVLQKAQVRIINYEVCNGLMNGQLTSRMLCAGVLSGGIDACQGDSGGPLSSPADSRTFLAGVVSWGDGCARRNKPGIYTTVTKFRGWIKEKTGV
ncbi:ST14 transmembrane serine protease matriptase a isoform X2 [Morone saxatilis]|uniref:ST14 transmembrane serine protease matriptase a isoform X2 n=1 Tax=Morone saxatilis TaxID=34816 RepID=UPI0015E23B39|nr:ST14 transmembrane serine protease matriptase a isoform X2 [Morone saxatilis]